MFYSIENPTLSNETNLEIAKIKFRQDLAKNFEITAKDYQEKKPHYQKIEEIMILLAKNEIENKLKEIEDEKELEQLRMRIYEMSDNMKIAVTSKHSTSLTGGYYRGEHGFNRNEKDQERYYGNANIENWAKDIVGEENVSQEKIIDLLRGEFASKIAYGFQNVGKKIKYDNKDDNKIEQPYNFSYRGPMETFLLLTQAEGLEPNEIFKKYNNVLWELRKRFPNNDKKEFDLALSRIGLKWDWENKTFKTF